MAVPKRKTGRMKTHSRRSSNGHYHAPTLDVAAGHDLVCPQCGEVKLPHTICPSCGYYKGREVLVVED